MVEETRIQLEDIKQDLLDSAENLPRNATVTKILEDDARRMDTILSEEEPVNPGNN